MPDTTPTAGDNRLRKNSLSTGAVTFLVVSAAAPLTRWRAACRWACCWEVVRAFPALS